jgi:hypothetical protein
MSRYVWVYLANTPGRDQALHLLLPWPLRHPPLQDPIGGYMCLADAVREPNEEKPRKFAFSKRSFCLRVMTFSFCAEALSTRESSHFVHILFIFPIYLNIDEMNSCERKVLPLETCLFVNKHPES